MALIKCPDCGKEISSSAKSCPNCGRPLEVKNSVGVKKPTILGFIGIVCGIIAIYCCAKLSFGLAGFFGFGGMIVCFIDICINRMRYNIIPSIIGIVICLLGVLDIFL